MPQEHPSAFFFTRAVTVTRAQASRDGFPDDSAVDDAAGRAEAYVPVSGWEAVPCCVQPYGGGARQVYGQRTLDVDHELFFARETAALQKDDVITDDASGAVYIVGAVGDEAEQGRVSWVLAKRYR